ncbi:MAG: hypothetical protein J7498_07240 [Sphingobium sp.]|nr:hypothetical protein [Sphingobium sp.]
MESREPNGKRPSEQRIGCRIRVKAEHAREAALLFEANGFDPIWIEPRQDGNISFWFGKAPGEELVRIFNSIPRHFHAIQAVVVGDNDPFAEKAGPPGVKPEVTRFDSRPPY